MEVEKDVSKSMVDADVVIFAVGHQKYEKLNPKEVVEYSGKLPLIIDCSNFLSDEKISKYIELGCKVKRCG